jgi:gamma-glutamyl phosphate reductase
MGQNELPLDTRHVGVPLGVSKMIYEPRVRLTQTVHLSCIEINIISKWTDTSFLLTHVT